MIGGACTVAALAGCAGTWDRVSSHSFWDAPLKNTFTSEDPITVLRTKVEGSERADAMRRLTEPAAAGRPAPEQDEALQMLGAEATANPSPVVRAAAIDALGRFQDPRAVGILIAAYHKADGLAADPRGADGVQQASAFRRADPTDPLSMLGPTGFEPVFVSSLRAKAVKSLSNSSTPEAVRFLANVAAAPPAAKPDSAPDAATADRDVRSAAVRGLGRMRTPEAVAALARVLKDEAGRDVVLASNAHAGLKELTGKDLPADPDQWDKVVQAGVQVQPEPNAVQRAVGWTAK